MCRRHREAVASPFGSMALSILIIIDLNGIVIVVLLIKTDPRCLAMLGFECSDAL